MKVFRSFVILCLFCNLNYLCAQPVPGPGCMIKETVTFGYDRVYQTQLPNEQGYTNVYRGYTTPYSDWTNSSAPLDDKRRNPCYRWIPNTVNTSCRVKYTSNCASPSCFYSGIHGQFTGPAVNCPVDDYIPWLILPIGVFGFYYMRKRSLII